MEGVLDRLAEQVGISRLGDPQAQRDPPRRGVGSRARSWTTARRGAEAVPRRDQADATTRRTAAGKAVGLGLGLKNSRPRQRLPRGLAAPSSASATATAASRCATAGPRWARACTPSRCRWPRRSSASIPTRIDVIVDTTRELGFGQTTGQPRHADGGRRRCSRRAQAALAAGCAPDVDYDGEHVVDWTQKLGDPDVPEPDHPLGVRLRRAAGRRRSRDRARSSRSSPSTTSAGPSTRCCARARSRAAVHMGLGYALTEDFPTDPRPGSRPT